MLTNYLVGGIMAENNLLIWKTLVKLQLGKVERTDSRDVHGRYSANRVI